MGDLIINLGEFMINILVLDDNEEKQFYFKNRFRKYNVDLVNSAEEAKILLYSNVYAFFFIECDVERQGYVNSDSSLQELIEWMDENNICRTTVIVIHSLDQYRSNELYGELFNKGYFILLDPFPCKTLIA